MAVRAPPAMSSGLSANMTEVGAMSESAFLEDSEEEDDEKDGEIEESMDSDSVSEDAEDEGPTAKDEDPTMKDEGLAVGVEGPGSDNESYGLDDEGHGLDDEGHGVESHGLGLEEKEAVPRGQQQEAPVVGTAVSAPLGLRYGALRRRELALKEDHVYNTFEVGQGSGSALESERRERVSASRQSTLTSWTDSKDGMVYIDVPAYPPPPPVQTSPSPEWTSSSLPISPSPFVVPSPVSSSLTVPSLVATPAAVKTDGFLTEGRGIDLSKAVRDEIFSQRYQFRSQEYEQERVAVTFGAIWRLVLALESWAGQMDAQRATLWYAISDMQGENQDLRLQLAEERCA
ncbi:hypothetical protein Tco_1038767 [Tanacetum coccineum]